ncbi:hypothetical protein BY458DRAFT_572331, partial [Sporodiniella umbellata]
LEFDDLENAKQFGLNVGLILRHKNESHKDLVLLNKRLKTKHDDHDNNGINSNNQETSWEWDLVNLPELQQSHTGRKGNYNLLEESDVPEKDEDTCSIEDYDPWMVEELNVLDECMKYTNHCFSKLEPKKLDDVGILIYLIISIATFQESITLGIFMEALSITIQNPCISENVFIIFIMSIIKACKELL